MFAKISECFFHPPALTGKTKERQDASSSFFRFTDPGLLRQQRELPPQRRRRHRPGLAGPGVQRPHLGHRARHHAPGAARGVLAPGRAAPRDVRGVLPQARREDPAGRRGGPRPDPVREPGSRQRRGRHGQDPRGVLHG